MEQRKTYDKMLAIYEEWRQSGISQKVYCKQKGVAYSTFQYWSKKVRERSDENNGSFIELQYPATSGLKHLEQPRLEIEYPSGVRIKLYGKPDALFIKSLIQ